MRLTVPTWTLGACLLGCLSSRLQAQGGLQAQGASLEEYLEAGLERNPDLDVLRQELATSAVDTLVISTAVNPHLEIEARHNLTDPESPSAGVRLSREFRPGFRGRTQRAARADIGVRQEDLRLAERETQSAIRSAYYDWQALTRKADLQREVLERWQRLADLAAGQVAQGKLSEVDEAEARLNALKARQTERTLLSERARAHRRLEVLTGLAAAPAPLDWNRMDSLPSLPGLDSLWARTRRESPLLAARRKEREAAKLHLDLEERNAMPPFTVSVGYDREVEGFHMIGGGIEIPLAFLNRNQAGIAKARSKVREGEKREAAAAAALRADVAERHARLLALAERYGHYRMEIRDLIRKQLSLSEKGFRQGMLGVFDLSRVQAEYLEQEAEALDILETYYREWNQLMATVGG